MDRHRSISGKIDNFFRNFPSGFTSNSENQDIVREKGKYRTQTLETAAISGKILVVKRVFPINMSDFICGMSSSGQKIIAFLDGWATKFRPFSNGCFRFYFDLDIDAGSYSFFSKHGYDVSFDQSRVTVCLAQFFFDVSHICFS